MSLQTECMIWTTFSAMYAPSFRITSSNAEPYATGNSRKVASQLAQSRPLSPSSPPVVASAAPVLPAVSISPAGPLSLPHHSCHHHCAVNSISLATRAFALSPIDLASSVSAQVSGSAIAAITLSSVLTFASDSSASPTVPVSPDVTSPASSQIVSASASITAVGSAQFPASILVSPSAIISALATAGATVLVSPDTRIAAPSPSFATSIIKKAPD
ncbi:hypothetical protein F5148DRAFT_1194844 [Russula earlei]|uniref:Uncharacterized protein n=1 Tax=Russula earlei TaxID=71964 RepID=A0ACC0UA78_9AGAM|nr:hypothetical protein F5148DRAFT_1194844 [Russula earlei]